MRPESFACSSSQHQARRPALGALPQSIQRRRGEHLAAQLCDRGKLFGIQAQVFPAERYHFARDAQSRAGCGRVAAAGDDHAAVLRHLAERGFEHRVQRPFRRHGVQIVEHQREWRLAARKQLAEEPARERSDIRADLRHIGGQIPGAPAIELACGVRQVMKQRRRVGVVRIDLVPQAAVAARLDVAGGERRLARARRPGDPRHRAARCAVEPRKQALARRNRADRRSRGLGEGHAAIGSISRQSRPPQPRQCFACAQV